MADIDVWDVLNALQARSGSASHETLRGTLPGNGLEEAIADGVKRDFLVDHGNKVRVDAG